jgi:hypothetical protein
LEFCSCSVPTCLPPYQWIREYYGREEFSIHLIPFMILILGWVQYSHNRKSTRRNGKVIGRKPSFYLHHSALEKIWTFRSLETWAALHFPIRDCMGKNTCVLNPSSTNKLGLWDHRWNSGPLCAVLWGSMGVVDVHIIIQEIITKCVWFWKFHIRVPLKESPGMGHTSTMRIKWNQVSGSFLRGMKYSTLVGSCIHWIKVTFTGEILIRGHKGESLLPFTACGIGTISHFFPNFSLLFITLY